MIGPLLTERLRGEPLERRHLPEIERMHANVRTMEHLGGVRSEAESLAYLERNLAHWERFGFGLWILRERHGTAMVGRGVLRHLDLDGVDEVEVGYGFYPEYWGRGLATEVCRQCIALGREEVGLQSIVALTTPANQASQQVMRKSGMAWDRDLMHGGTPHVLFRTIDAAP